MAKTSRGGRRSASQNTAQSTATAQATSGGAITYKSMTNADAQQIRNDVDDKYTPSVRDAIKQYIANDTKYTGKQYSKSQTLNHKLDTDQQLNANEKYMVKYMQQGMHDMGMDVELTRGCHENFLQGLGIQNYASMSETQLKSALVGTEYKTKSFSSFSYDTSMNPFLGNGPYAGGREVIIKQKTKASTKVVFGAKSQSEIITNIGTKSKITNVYFTGGTATPKGAGTKPVIVIETETV